MKPYFCAVLLATTVSAINLDQVTNRLQPVQSLYVKPSADGSTGDLYVAATEDNGISRWLTDNPVNFLNSAAMALKSAAMLPTNLSPGFPAAIINQEESANQNRAVINSGTSSIFGSPQIETETKNALSSTVETSLPTEKSSATPIQTPFQYSPYQFMYPNLLATGLTDQKDVKDFSTSLAQAQAAYWPSAAYSYATYPYMMMDPRFWAWAQAASAAANQGLNTEGTSGDEKIKE